MAANARSADYRWVEDGLATLGLTLDLTADELPYRYRGAASLSVQRLVTTTVGLFGDDSEWLTQTRHLADPAGRWRAVAGRLTGSATVVERTTIMAPAALTRDRFVTFAVDDAMLDAAKVWDTTFVSGAFTHVIHRGGEVHRAGERSLAGASATDVAKVMRWIFRVPGLTNRELVSVYVTHGDERSMTCCYLPVRGPALAEGPSAVRARLLLPCADHARFDGERCTSFVHVAAAALGGRVPRALNTSGLYKRAFLGAAKGEADLLTSLFSGDGPEGRAFVQLSASDGLLANRP